MNPPSPAASLAAGAPRSNRGQGAREANKFAASLAIAGLDRERGSYANNGLTLNLAPPTSNRLRIGPRRQPSRLPVKVAALRLQRGRCAERDFGA